MSQLLKPNFSNSPNALEVNGPKLYTAQEVRKVLQEVIKRDIEIRTLRDNSSIHHYSSFANGSFMERRLGQTELFAAIQRLYDVSR